MRKAVQWMVAGAMALLSTSPSAAQQPAGQARANAPSEIVVTGRRDLNEQIRDFVGALTPASSQGQLGRFEWAVCPAALRRSSATLRLLRL